MGIINPDLDIEQLDDEISNLDLESLETRMETAYAELDEAYGFYCKVDSRMVQPKEGYCKADLESLVQESGLELPEHINLRSIPVQRTHVCDDIVLESLQDIANQVWEFIVRISAYIYNLLKSIIALIVKNFKDQPKEDPATPEEREQAEEVLKEDLPEDLKEKVDNSAEELLKAASQDVQTKIKDKLTNRAASLQEIIDAYVTQVNATGNWFTINGIANPEVYSSKAITDLTTLLITYNNALLGSVGRNHGLCTDLLEKIINFNKKGKHDESKALLREFVLIYKNIQLVNTPKDDQFNSNRIALTAYRPDTYPDILKESSSQMPNLDVSGIEAVVKDWIDGGDYENLPGAHLDAEWKILGSNPGEGINDKQSRWWAMRVVDSDNVISRIERYAPTAELPEDHQVDYVTVPVFDRKESELFIKGMSSLEKAINRESKREAKTLNKAALLNSAFRKVRGKARNINYGILQTLLYPFEHPLDYSATSGKIYEAGQIIPKNVWDQNTETHTTCFVAGEVDNWIKLGPLAINKQLLQASKEIQYHIKLVTDSIAEREQMANTLNVFIKELADIKVELDNLNR